MKKILFCIFAVVFAGCFASCGHKATKAQTETDSVKLDSIDSTDTASIDSAEAADSFNTSLSNLK